MKEKEDKHIQKVTLYMPDDLRRQLKIRAAVDGEPMSTLAERAIDFYLNHSDLLEGVQGSAHLVYEAREGDQPVTFDLSNELHTGLEDKSAQSGLELEAHVEEAIDFYLNSRLEEEPDSIRQFILSIKLDDNNLDDEIALEIAELCKDINAYHIACGGTGLVIDEWDILVRVRQLVGV